MNKSTQASPAPAIHAPYVDLPAMAYAEGVIALPGSKSISNRTLLLAALAAGDTVVRGLLDAEDVDRMREALATLGIARELEVAERQVGMAADLRLKLVGVALHDGRVCLADLGGDGQDE